MPKAMWEGQVLAESDSTVMVEGNHYFPPEAVNHRFLAPSESQTVCPWKGRASYYHILVDGKINYDAAWYYPKPFQAARVIKDYVAFWRGVVVVP